MIFKKHPLPSFRYLYTALVISVMWIGVAAIVALQQYPETELLVILTAICSVAVALIGFDSPK